MTLLVVFSYSFNVCQVHCALIADGSDSLLTNCINFSKKQFLFNGFFPDVIWFCVSSISDLRFVIRFCLRWSLFALFLIS